LRFFALQATTLDIPKEIPAKYLGSWSVDRSADNFDQYLEAKGYGWIMRQIVKMASITKIFTSKGNGLYNCKVLTTKKNVEWDNWMLDKEFQAEYVDESQHKITFSYDPILDKLIEKHVKVDATAADKPDIYTYQIVADELVMTMTYESVETKRYYKKVTTQ